MSWNLLLQGVFDNRLVAKATSLNIKMWILRLQQCFFALNVSADYKMQLKNFMRIAQILAEPQKQKCLVPRSRK